MRLTYFQFSSAFVFASACSVACGSSGAFVRTESLTGTPTSARPTSFQCSGMFTGHDQEGTAGSLPAIEKENDAFQAEPKRARLSWPEIFFWRPSANWATPHARVLHCSSAVFADLVSISSSAIASSVAVPSSLTESWSEGRQSRAGFVGDVD